MAKDSDNRDFDPTTGNPLKDGYSPTGARRPLTRKPGEILSSEDAERVDSFDREWGGAASFAWPYDE